MGRQMNDMYTSLEREVIADLAAIEASDRDMCAGCGGEDCQCCEIYLDRQKWVGPDQLFGEELY